MASPANSPSLKARSHRTALHPAPRVAAFTPNTARYGTVLYGRMRCERTLALLSVSECPPRFAADRISDEQNVLQQTDPTGR